MSKRITRKFKTILKNLKRYSKLDLNFQTQYIDFLNSYLSLTYAANNLLEISKYLLHIDQLFYLLLPNVLSPSYDNLLFLFLFSFFKINYHKHSNSFDLHPTIFIIKI